jgi:hypothetical protein
MGFYLGDVLNVSKINLIDQSKWLLSTPPKKKNVGCTPQLKKDV